jgi:NADPH:quinone reductase-like Zn-dependent oxidoreductase
MQAIQIHSYGGPEELKLEQTPHPVPQVGEVLVRVYAAGVNPIDWKIRQGLMKDFELGPGVTAFEVGQAVFGRCDNGAYAEYVAVPVENLAPKPQALSFVAAAQVPVGVTTAWRALFEHGKLTSGQRVLIQGAAGGVGQFAVQLAKWKGAEVIGTASTVNLEFVRSLGADMVVDYTTTPVESVVQDVDLVLDGVGVATLRSSLNTLRRGGTLISIAALPPQEEAQARGVRAMMSRGAASAPLEMFAQLIDEGLLKVPEGSTFPLSLAQQAHEHSQRGHGRGRLVLRVTN